MLFRSFGSKPRSPFFAARDRWLFNNQSPDVGQYNYIKGLVWFKQTVQKNRPDLWWQEDPDPQKTIPPAGGLICNKIFHSLTKKKVL